MSYDVIQANLKTINAIKKANNLVELGHNQSTGTTIKDFTFKDEQQQYEQHYPFKLGINSDDSYLTIEKGNIFIKGVEQDKITVEETYNYSIIDLPDEQGEYYVILACQNDKDNPNRSSNHAVSIVYQKTSNYSLKTNSNTKGFFNIILGAISATVNTQTQDITATILYQGVQSDLMIEHNYGEGYFYHYAFKDNFPSDGEIVSGLQPDKLYVGAGSLGLAKSAKSILGDVFNISKIYNNKTFYLYALASFVNEEFEPQLSSTWDNPMKFYYNNEILSSVYTFPILSIFNDDNGFLISDDRNTYCFPQQDNLVVIPSGSLSGLLKLKEEEEKFYYYVYTNEESHVSGSTGGKLILDYDDTISFHSIPSSVGIFKYNNCRINNVPANAGTETQILISKNNNVYFQNFTLSANQNISSLINTNSTSGYQLVFPEISDDQTGLIWYNENKVSRLSSNELTENEKFIPIMENDVLSWSLPSAITDGKLYLDGNDNTKDFFAEKLKNLPSYGTSLGSSYINTIVDTTDTNNFKLDFKFDWMSIQGYHNTTSGKFLTYNIDTNELQWNLISPSGDYKIKSVESDTNPDYLLNKLKSSDNSVSISLNQDFTIDFSVSGGTGSSDHKVKATENDDSPGFLDSKIYNTDGSITIVPNEDYSHLNVNLISNFITVNGLGIEGPTQGKYTITYSIMIDPASSSLMNVYQWSPGQYTINITGLQTKLGSIESDITDLSSTVQGYQNRIAALETQITQLSSIVQEYQQRISAVEGWAQALAALSDGFIAKQNGQLTSIQGTEC